MFKNVELCLCLLYHKHLFLYMAIKKQIFYFLNKVTYYKKYIFCTIVKKTIVPHKLFGFMSVLSFSFV